MGIDTTSLLLNYGALGVVLILLLTGVLVPGFVYRKLERENETYRDQRNADLQQFAVTGQKAIVALAEVAEERWRGNAESRDSRRFRASRRGPQQDHGKLETEKWPLTQTTS